MVPINCFRLIFGMKGGDEPEEKFGRRPTSMIAECGLVYFVSVQISVDQTPSPSFFSLALYRQEAGLSLMC